MNANQLKCLITIMLVIAGVTVLAGCSSRPEAETELALEDGDVRIFEVFGMDCPGCHGGLEKLVEAIPGVIDSKASWQDKSVSVKISKDEEVNDNDIRNAIERANFTPGERLK